MDQNYRNDSLIRLRKINQLRNLKTIQSQYVSLISRVSELPGLPNNMPVNAGGSAFHPWEGFQQSLLLFLTMVLERAFLPEAGVGTRSSWRSVPPLRSSWFTQLPQGDSHFRPNELKSVWHHTRQSRNTGAWRSQDWEVRPQLRCTSLNCLETK